MKWTGFQDVIQSEIGDHNINFILRKEKDFITGMKRFDEETDLDLMVILNEKRGFFEDIFTSSNTKNMLSNFSFEYCFLYMIYNLKFIS